MLESLEIVNLSHILPDQSAISAKEEFQATLEDIPNFQETLLKNDVEQEAHKETFREMLLLLRDWAFMLFAVSNFLTSLGYPIPYTFVPVNTASIKIVDIVFLYS